MNESSDFVDEEEEVRTNEGRLGGLLVVLVVLLGCAADGDARYEEVGLKDDRLAILGLRVRERPAVWIGFPTRDLHFF